MPHVQLLTAVFATFVTIGVAQEFYNEFHFGIVVKHPSGSDGTVIGGINQCQSVCQSAWISFDKHVKVGMLANLSGIKFFNKFRHSLVNILRTYHAEKSLKFLLAFQQ